MASEDGRVSFKPVTADNWNDMQELFGDKGAYGGCWCTYWRLGNKEFNSLSASERKTRMESTIESGVVPGILAYRNGTPIGWCSFGRREEFPRLEKSRILGRVDDENVLSIVCFYIDRHHRREGVMTGLLQEVVHIAESSGISVVEGYPIDPKNGAYPDPYAYTGLMSAFKKSGFVEVDRRSEKRPIMRYYVEKGKTT